MSDLLKFESDLQTIQIVKNYAEMSQSDGAMAYSERKKYISKVGYLYPERYEMLNQANDLKQIQAAVECTDYHEMLSNVKQDGAENEVESRGKTLGKSPLIYILILSQSLCYLLLRLSSVASIQVINRLFLLI